MPPSRPKSATKSMISSTKTGTHSSSGWSEENRSNFEYHQEKTSSFSTSSGGLLSGGSFSSSSLDAMDQAQKEKSLETAEASLKERETRLNERETELEKREADLTNRENALDAAHERLIGGEEDEDEESGDNKASSSSMSAIIEELRQENSKLHAELAAANKRSGRFLSQRAQQEDASGFDRFRLSERKPRDSTKSGGGLLQKQPMGFDPQLMARWKSGHEMMSPRKPGVASSKTEGE